MKSDGSFFKEKNVLFAAWEWFQRLFTHSANRKADAAGLIMIQIDGLSCNQLKSALKSGRLPFLKQLIEKEQHAVHSLYSGIPSSTPAVQAELFYGVHCAVPSFAYFNRELWSFENMLSSCDAGRVQHELEKRGKKLLTGGCAYSNILTGGALKAFFCITNMGFGSIVKGKNLVTLIALIMMHWFLIFRILKLLCLEFIIAVYDLFQGLRTHQRIKTELRFLPARVGLCVLLRELIVFGAKADISGGKPLIHCNFLGYDEQAHRRGPSSGFAHWTLRGIDDSIKRIVQAAKKSNQKYVVLIYSDHGQEKVVSYIDKYGKSLQDAIAGVLKRPVTSSISQPLRDTGIQMKRAVLMGERWFNHSKNVQCDSQNVDIIVSAVGPLGHIYIKDGATFVEKSRLAKKIVQGAHVPAVLFTDSNKKCFVCHHEKMVMLPHNGGEIVGWGHPFLDEVINDLIVLANHVNSGDLICLGYSPQGISLSFPLENGAHAGPGPEETHAFVILPRDFLLQTKKSVIRPSDLHRSVLHFINKNLTVGR